MSEYLIHTAKAGDRWDTLAYDYYGDVNHMTQIHQANRDLYFLKGLPTPTAFKGGEILKIPVIEQEILDANKLPPWKR